MRVIPIFLLGLLIQLPFWVTEFSLHLQRKETRKIAKELIYRGLNESDLVAISIQESGCMFHWEKEHEFEYDGMLYDIVRTENCAGDTIVYCWPDHAESRIKKKLNSLHNQFLQQSPVRQDQQNRIWSFYQSLYFEQVNDVFPCQGPKNFTIIQSFRFEDARQTGWASVAFTPPDFVSFIGKL
ncbi:MAG: hypothetical protein LW630_09695 [Saprospiraceae bacterium]|jgi:hypothetical protein|nr:hypothetical protein [Saprospiraceae bacterium]